MIKIFRIKSVRWPRTKTKWALSKPIIWVHFILREFIRAHNTFNVVKPSRVINVNLSFFLGTKPFFVPAWILFRIRTKSEFHIWSIPFMADKHLISRCDQSTVHHKMIKHEGRCIRCEWSNLSCFSESAPVPVYFEMLFLGYQYCTVDVLINPRCNACMYKNSVSFWC